MECYYNRSGRVTSPPLGHGNFKKTPVVYNGPYEYSVPGMKDDFYHKQKK